MKQYTPTPFPIDGTQFVAMWEHNGKPWAQAFYVDGPLLRAYDPEGARYYTTEVRWEESHIASLAKTGELTVLIKE